MSTTSNCPCDTCNFPAVISNVPGLSTILYRVGDFTSFRDAMLHALPNEVELANWKPTTTSDLALQMIEWWAYLSDILTFYNQRIANQDYLRTADIDASVNRLIRVLGYRPRPGIGARATLAALVSAKQAITLPQGFAVQSKPGPGKTPQIFELSADTMAQPGGSVSADPDNSQAVMGTDGSVLLQGTVTSIKPGDLLLLVEKNWNGNDTNYVAANVIRVQPQSSPRGTTNTQVVLGTSALSLPAGAIAANYRLLRSTQTARLFQYGVALSLSLANGNTADLDSAVRQIKPNDLVLFDSTGQTANPPHRVVSKPPIGIPDPLSAFGQFDLEHLQTFIGQVATPAVSQFAESEATLDTQFDISSARNLAETGIASQVQIESPLPPPLQLAYVKTYTELIWYADDPTSPTTPSSATTGIPVLHSHITFTPAVTETDPTAVVIRYGWQDVGVLISPPATSFTANVGLVAVTPPNFAPGKQPVLLEDVNGNGDSATGTVNSDATTEMQLVAPLSPALTPPIDVLTNLLPFTRGKTVSNEVLGSGDASVAGQEFTLAKSPLTYLLSPDSTSGANYTSTLQVWVNSVQWKEQPSFYGQKPDAAIFVTREDENNITHVQFGDGTNGARLPTGTSNVIADYRYGSGQDAPDANRLTVITKSQPGLTAIVNPVAAGGGADPELSSQIRKYAPMSVLAFDRAISGDDYEAIAASTPGVQRASAVWSFDTSQQRTVVTVYVGDDQSAQAAAQLALSGDADPNRPVNVQLAQPIALTLSLTLAIDPNHAPDSVVAGATAALTDPDVGLFGENRIGIGEVIYRSQIYAACLSISGALAVHDLQVTGAQAGSCYRFDPGEGGFFSVDPTAGLAISPEVANAG
ncbi:MAG TPA: baseplate J/gp47 family protein [Candidatus Sulfotelmatobacter sp.]|nr:baseplate J/gp47 family protein [Candidatus Sulfotelmatobacter sp.]